MGLYYVLLVSPNVGNLIREFLLLIANTLGAKSDIICQGYREIRFWK